MNHRKTLTPHHFAALGAFALGLIAVAWVAVGYVGISLLALTVSFTIAAVYLAGANELRRFQRDTARLDRALQTIPDDLGQLGDWLQQLPGALQNAVRLRLEGERVALPGPTMTPYLVGLLVLLGMLGTFLGMVVTLNGAVLALESTTDLHTIRAALAAPVKGLGVAFGTSVAGVATSAMLGLISALCRRERQRASQLLDRHIAGALHGFSLAHQRQETFKALQAQARALPELVGALQTMMTQIGDQHRTLNDQLQAGQQAFHREAREQYAALAQSVDQSLKASLSDSARLAAEGIQPVVAATMGGIAEQTQQLHDRLALTVDGRLTAISGQLGEVAGQLADGWRTTLERHTRTGDEHNRALHATLDGFARRFADDASSLLSAVDRAQAELRGDLAQRHAALVDAAQSQQATLGAQLTQQLDGLLERVDGAAGRIGEQWTQALTRHEAASTHLIAALDQTRDGLTAGFSERSAALLGELREAQAQWQRDWTAGENTRQQNFSDALQAIAARLETQWQHAGEATLAQQAQITRHLGDTARDIAASTQQQAQTTIAEVTRLMQTAAEAPKAAAEVIAQLRHELSASMARDNSLLEERSRIMETLGGLLDAINHASTEQRSAIDALVASSAELLARVENRFAERVDRETGKLLEVGSGLAGSALEVASLGEVFGQAVEAFAASSDKTMATLQRIESALAKSMTRSDEQLAYYVAQAREIIDLSIMAQKRVVDDLQHNAGEA